MKMFARILSLSLVAVLLCAALVSCAPASDPDKAAAALKDADYTVDTTFSALAFALVDDVEDVVSAAKLSGKDAIIIVYFKDSASAKDAEEKVKELVDADKEQEEDSNFVFKRSGKMIYAGTKDAVKDAR